MAEIARRWQQPHLTILEFAWDFDETMTDLYAERYGIDEPIIKGDIFGGSEWLYDVTFWKERYIWLCPPNSTVTFESHSDVIDALNNELESCYHGNAT